MPESDPTPERWLPVVGWEGVYEVSDAGRVKRVAVGMGSRPGRVRAERPHTSGYHVCVLYRDNDRTGKIKYIHRLLAEAFIGPPTAERRYINHKNGVKADNRVENLEWVTASENSTHLYRVLGYKLPRFRCAGEKSPHAKLTSAAVLDIRRRKRAGESLTTLATAFGVHKSAISKVVRRESWAHLPDDDTTA